MRRTYRSRRHVVVAGLILALGVGTPATAVDTTLPDSCKLHPTKVVNPGCVPTLKQPGVTLPNLVPDVQETFVLRPFVVDPETGGFVEGDPLLYFDSRAQNLGEVPLQLTVDEVESPDSSTVSQCVSWTSLACRAQQPVGGFTWHAEHTHFHYSNFAAYQLRRLGPDARPDYSDAGLIASSDKVSFCLIDSEQVDPEANPAPVYNTCLPTVQGISAGWTDIYTSDLEGQQLPLAGLSDGRYALVVSLNYGQHVLESDYGDDVVEVTLEISNDLHDVQIVSRHYP